MSQVGRDDTVDWTCQSSGYVSEEGQLSESGQFGPHPLVDDKGINVIFQNINYIYCMNVRYKIFYF